jgi:hypothetical protein
MQRRQRGRRELLTYPRTESNTMLHPPSDTQGNTPYDNSSGMGSRSPVPPEIQKWNWGAFLLNWIWSIGNGAFVGLLVFVPVLGLFIPFFLGAKGSRWAWQNRRWESVATFQRVQRRWTQVGVALVVLSVGMAVAGLYFVAEGYKRLDIYTLAAQSLDDDAELRNIVGGSYTLAATGFNLGGNSASFDFDVVGPGRTTAVRVYVEKVRGQWIVFDSVLLDDAPDSDPGDDREAIDGETCKRPPVVTV